MAWHERLASASLPSCQPLLFIQSDTSTRTRPLFLSDPATSLPPSAISPMAARRPHLESVRLFDFYLQFFFSPLFCLLGQKLLTQMNELIFLFFEDCWRNLGTSGDQLVVYVQSVGGGCAVCLCVALLDMMRDDIMVDAAAASSEMRKAPICLTLAGSNVSICHSPQDRTLVFIKINILCHSEDLFFYLYLFILHFSLQSNSSL